MTKRKIPTVRIGRPSGRPFQLRYTCPVEEREVRISTNTRDEHEAERQKKELEAKLLLGIDFDTNLGPVRHPKCVQIEPGRHRE